MVGEEVTFTMRMFRAYYMVAAGATLSCQLLVSLEDKELTRIIVMETENSSRGGGGGGGGGEGGGGGRRRRRRRGRRDAQESA